MEKSVLAASLSPDTQPVIVPRLFERPAVREVRSVTHQARLINRYGNLGHDSIA